MSGVELTTSQRLALSALEGGENVFLTGGAGTGKSFLIKQFLSAHKGSKISILASTGAAAILVGGRTFHSFFGLGIMQGGASAVLQKARDNRRLKKRLRDSSILIIDEVSMLSREAFDCAELVARTLREVDEPWGGLRLVVVGDFAQLPPVSQGFAKNKDWAFLGNAWAQSGFLKFELTEFVRTEEADFLEVLKDVRNGELTERVEEFLESRVVEEMDGDVPHLFSRRDQTERFNLSRLAEIDDESRIYETKYIGESRYFDQLKRDAPIPEMMELKRGALVMLRMNDPKQRFVNGTLAHIRSMGDDYLVVETATRSLEIEPFSFSYVDADGNEAAHAINFPISLAYASTIHKIQGSTLDRAHIDLGNLWEPGQAYVALSRVRRAKDMSLMRWSPSAIKADPDVKLFYASPSFKPRSYSRKSSFDF